MKKQIFLIASIIYGVTSFSQNIILNGSFEDLSDTVNTTCLDNTTWSGTVNNSWGISYGVQSVIIMDPDVDPVCVFANDGTNYVELPSTCLSLSYNFVIFSLKLSEQLMSGHEYRLGFYGKKCNLSNSSSQVKIGYSSDSTLFGTTIYTSSFVDSAGWEYFEYQFTFISPSDDNLYLTVSTETPALPATPYDIQLDNFSLINLTTLGLNGQNTNDFDVRIFPNPSVSNVQINLNEQPFTGTINLYSITGQKIFSNQVNNILKYELTSEHFKFAGIYVIELIGKDGKNFRSKIVYNK